MLKKFPKRNHIYIYMYIFQDVYIHLKNCYITMTVVCTIQGGAHMGLLWVQRGVTMVYYTLIMF